MSIKAYSSYTVIDVVDGIQWQANATSHPANPKESWAYYNTQDKKSYIYDGEQWVVFASDGGDAYTVILTNESHTFAGSTSYATGGQEAVTKVIAYKGSTEVAAKVVSVNGVASSTSNTSTGITGLSFNCSATSPTMSPQVTFTTGSHSTTSTRFTTTPCSITIVIEVDGRQFSKTFSCSIAFQGSTGSSATSYWLIASDSVIQKSLAPTTLTFSGYYKTGTGSVYSYSGRWVVSYTTDGTNYVELYKSTSNQSSVQITVDPSYKAIRCQMYLSSGTSILLDEQTVPIVGDGYTPVKGVDYFDGTNGTNGTSIVWKGEFDAPPNNPENGWAYYDNTQHASYVYQDGWYQMSIDGVDGKNGDNGISIIWKGELSQQPANGEENWVYKDKEDGIVYICTGNGLWEPMVADGSDGTNGTDGFSVFITYNDSEDTPNVPTGDGTTNGWHTNATSSVVWMSQKVAESAASGSWGAPIKIKGESGKDGTDGEGISEETFQYYQSSSCTSAPDPEDEWSDEFPESWDTAKPYVWRRTKQVWTKTESDGSYTRKTKYIGIQLMSQLDVATIMAQKSGQTLDQWCIENDTTIISGSQIATGAITTDKLAANAITSINYYKKDENGKDTAEKTGNGMQLNLADGTWDSANFKIDDEGNIVAQGGEIAGWDISDDEISKGDLHLCSGEKPYRSLLTDGGTSNVRIYTGDYSEINNNEITTSMSFPAGTTTSTFYLPEEDINKHCIITGARCKNATYSFTGIKRQQQVTITTSLIANKYTGGIDIDLLPTLVEDSNIKSINVTIDDSTGGTVQSSSGSYIGDGKVRVSVRTNRAITVTCTVMCEFDFIEIANVDVEYTKQTITATLHPELPEQDYHFFFAYTVDTSNMPFAILNDGSLYARNADITGTIHATDGSFTGTVYATNGFFTGEINADVGKFGNLQIEGDKIVSMTADDDVGVVFNNDGSIDVPEIRANNVITDSISGVLSDSPALLFNSTTSTRTVSIVLSTVEVDNDMIKVTISTSDNSVLNAKKNFVVQCKYYTITSPYAAYSKSVMCSIDANSSTGSVLIYQYVETKNGSGVWAQFNSAKVSQPTFEEIVPLENPSLVCTTSFIPSIRNQCDIGTDPMRWKDLYLKNSPNVTSDRNQKNTIEPLTDAHTQIFDSLQPVSYKFNENTSDRTHIGLIAQDVKSAVEHAGMTTKDFAGYCEWTDNDGNVECGLRYEEFIALCIDQIQKLKRRVEELEKK